MIISMTKCIPRYYKSLHEYATRSIDQAYGVHFAELNLTYKFKYDHSMIRERHLPTAIRLGASFATASRDTDCRKNLNDGYGMVIHNRHH